VRTLGVVYTPPEVTAPMARLAIALAGRGPDDLPAICDPAIGEGAFLVAAAGVVRDHLIGLGVAEPEARARAAGCVYGVDVDPRAVAAARAAIGAGPAQLQVADALALDWPAAFPEVFARGGFDVVLGNPPYVRQEHLGAQKRLLRGYASYDGVADLYVYFVELAHRLLRPRGRFCLITPNKWLTCAYGRPLRRFLAGAASVEGIVDLGRSALFDDADAFPCIVWGTRDAPAATPLRAARLAPGAPIALDGALQPRERWRDAPWHIDPPDERALLDRLEARWPPLHALVPERPARGVVTGCNRAFVLDRAARDRLLAAEPGAARVIRPFVKGRDLRRWRTPAPERWILLIDRGTSLDDLPAVAAHLAQLRAALEPRATAAPGPGRKPGAYRWYELQDPVGPLIKRGGPRLLYQDIQTEPICSLDPDGALVPDTTVWMLPTDDLYLLAVLGSPVYAWYARRRFPPALNGSVRPKAAHLRTLPIATPAPDLRAAIVGLVEHRLASGDPALDAPIHRAVLEAYELGPRERALIVSR
jgi:SAM-dependent methyltransferase